VEIEVTEDAMVSDIATAKAILTSFKNLGMRVALDDFGTGYSSLRHLAELPLDTLKIDQSFVRSMNSGENGLVIVKSIVQLAKNLGLGLIAEGIETEQQAILLRGLGCDHGQGFYLGRPSPGIARPERRSTKDHENEPSASAGTAPAALHVQQAKRRAKT
jgi:EAL domain-containing protein (putative c-di-GMP-specific phosphodiesterase class I)